MHEHLEGFIVARSYAATSAKQRRQLVGQFIAEVGDGDPNDVTVADAYRWWASIAHLAPASRRAHLSAVRAFIAHLRAIGVMDSDPTESITAPRVQQAPPVTLTHAEVVKLLASVVEQRDRVAVALMVGCGLRGGDVANLSVQDCDTDGRILRVPGKGGKVRLVPMPHLVAELVGAHIDGLPGDAAVIRNHDGTRMSASHLRWRVTRELERAGVKRGPLDGRSSHVLRRTCATTVLEGGQASLEDVRQLLGHASLTSTSRYLARPSVQRLLGAIETGPLGDAA